MLLLSQNKESDSLLSVIGISKQLDISKIYLEQVFSLLRIAGLVSSVKGSQGGYKLSRSAEKITAYDILSVTENAIFEETEETVKASQPEMERALQDVLYKPGEKLFREFFEHITLYEMAEKAFKNAEEDWFMYGI
jgi:Rrf2 family protein